ncbi:MAG: DUF6364 family protein [Cyclobacteriaceae bacterium]|jgi:hypothetical protein|nr:DUF6364 family protein [Cyclobacteriaceae bacterium]
MTTKLTLSVKAKTVAKAKNYAKRKGISVSKIFEDHISSITNTKEAKPLARLKKVKRSAKLAGKIKDNSILELKSIFGKVPDDFDYKKELYKIVEDKHLS